MENSQEVIIKKPYGVISGYFFANFGIAGLGGILSAIFIYFGKTPISSTDRDRAFIGLVVGIPCIIMAALIMSYVTKKAKRTGYGNVAGEFISYSVILMAKVMVILSIILIPIFKFIFSSWEERTITNAFGVKKRIKVRYIGGGQYEDIEGDIYEEN